MYRVVIGMEFHLQANTKTKLFSRAPMSFGAEANSNVAVVDNGMPGALPCVNREAILKGIKTALALNMKISDRIEFDRKHYSYPDLPLKYQITQIRHPIGEHGYVEINGKKIRLNRLALEADAGKNIHLGNHSYVDLNRCSSPLLEVITEPDISSAQEAAQVFALMQSVARYLGTSDADMEKGQLRADINVSVTKTNVYGTRVEIKNINSRSFAQQALAYEIQRHIDCLESGQRIIMETRGYNPATKETFSMRSKETVADYRYIPEPDIPQIPISQELIESIRASLPVLPQQKIRQWIEEFDIPTSQATTLAEEPATARYFDQTVAEAGNLASITLLPNLARQIATLMLADFAACINKDKSSYSDAPVKPLSLAQLSAAIVEGKISTKQAKDVFQLMYDTGENAADIIRKNNISQITDPKQLLELAQHVIKGNVKQLEQYKAGNEKLFGFFVGQAIKLSRGQANPELLNEAVKQALAEAI